MSFFDLGIRKSKTAGIWLRKPSYATVADWLEARKEHPHRAHGIFLRGTLCDAQGAPLWDTPERLMDEIPHDDMLELLSEAMVVSGIDQGGDTDPGNAETGETT